MATKYLDKIGLAYFWSKIKAWIESTASNLMHRTGDETIEGTKAFQNSYHDSTQPGQENYTSSSLLIRIPDYDKGTDAETNHHGNIVILDKDGTNQNWNGRLGIFEHVVYGGTTRANQTRITNYRNVTVNGEEVREYITLGLGYDDDGNSYASAPSTSALRNNGTDIVTRNWIPNDNRIVHTTGNETIDGVKTFSSVIQGDISGTAGSVAWTNVTGKPSSFTPSSHAHGNITNDGKVGTTSGLPLITGTNGVVQTGSFGNSAGTFCQGNDSRLSNARTPTSHTHGNIVNDGTLATANAVVITDGSKKILASTSVTTTELGYLDGVTSSIQTQLDSKAADSGVVHTTGNETVDGNKTFVNGITFADKTGTESINAFYGKVATSDYFRIQAGGTAANAGYLEIATADDGTEPIYVRQYKGVFNTVYKELILLNGDGNTHFPGSIKLKNSNITKGTPPASSTWWNLQFTDVNNAEMGSLQYGYLNNGQSYMRVGAVKSDTTNFAGLYVGFDSDGTAYASVPSTKSTRSEGTDIVTRDWIPQDTRIVHTTGDEAVSGVKTFSSRIEINSPYLDAVRFNYSDALLIPSTFPANTVYRGYSVRDGAGRILVECYHRVNANAHAKVWQMHNLSAVDATAQFAFTYSNSTNKFYLSGPAQFDTDDDSSKIPNTAWIRDATGDFACNAATTTKLKTARTINGVSFDGSANITVADSTKLPLSGGTVTGNITWNETATISGTSTTHQCSMTMNNSSLNFGSYDHTNNKWVWYITPYGNASFEGNASTATKFAASKTIAISGGATGTATAFDGSANITIPVTALDMSKASAGTLTVARGGTGLTSLDTFVRTTGAQSIAGIKTFTDHQDIAKEAINALRFRDTRVSTSATINTTTYQGMYWYNNDNDATASIYRRTDATDKTNALSFNVYAPDDDSANAYMSLQQPLKSSGGKGYLYLDGNFALNGLDIKKSTDNSTLTVMGGTDKTNNPYLQLNGKDASANKGVFSLWARDGTNNANFLGKPDGTLTWAGENLYNLVHRSGNETIAGSKTFTALPIIDRTGSTLAAGALAHVLVCKYKNTAGNVDFTTYPISVIGNDATNATNIGVRLGSINGTTIVTAGECGGSFASTVGKYNDENLYLTADNEIQMYVKCANNSTSYAGPIVISGTAASGGTNSTTSITATNFNGNASTATTLSSTLAVDKGGTGATTLDDAGIVTKTGSQTISGEKTFSTTPTISRINPYLQFVETDWAKGDTTGSTSYQGILFRDKNIVDAGSILFHYYPSSQTASIKFSTYNLTTASASGSAQVFLTYKTGGVMSLNPETSGTILLGRSDAKWKEVWCNQSSMNSTSDERLKNNIENISNNILDAWEDVKWVKFKYNDASKEKGAENARIHTGMIAQQVKTVFENNNIDINKYGFFLYDKWEAEEAEYDEKGILISPAKEAGDQYGLRYTEALCIEAAYQRRKNKILENRISELEKQVSDMIILLQNLTNSNG